MAFRGKPTSRFGISGNGVIVAMHTGLAIFAQKIRTIGPLLLLPAVSRVTLPVCLQTSLQFTVSGKIKELQPVSGRTCGMKAVDILIAGSAGCKGGQTASLVP